MYARIARFEGGDISQIDAVIDGARQMIDSTFDSPPEGLEGAKAVWMLVDRENAKGLGITLFENEEDLRRGDEALNAMSPPCRRRPAPCERRDLRDSPPQGTLITASRAADPYLEESLRGELYAD